MIQKHTFPQLVFDEVKRVREFNSYTEEERASVVYHYLVEGLAFRVMDSEILKLTFNSNGWQSMGICHYLGLVNIHKGFFKGWHNSEILNSLYSLSSDPDFCIIYYYIASYLDSQQSLTDLDKNILLLSERLSPRDEINNKIWIRNTLLKGTKDLNIDKKILSLPNYVDNQEKTYLINNVECYIRNSTISESVKSLYDYHCQICGDVILRTGWDPSLSRRQEWKFLSADVHHIKPLSQNGEDDRRNMLCLCPSCHRKFHSGEFRLKQKNSDIILQDELLGVSKEIRIKHLIVL